MPKRIFLSDIHMGPGRVPEGPRYGYDWLSPAEKKNVAGFLNHIRDNEESSAEVILLGDILDNWICPHDEQPPTFREIFAANAEIIDSIGGLLDKGMRVTFIEGNHDMHLTQNGLDDLFGANVKYAESYLDNGVYAAHGHSFDPFNNRVQSPGALYNLPLGYFISRVVATKQATVNSDKRPIFEILKNTMNAVARGGSVAVSVFDTLIKDTGLDEDPDFVMADGNVLSADEVRASYRDTDVSLGLADLKPRAEFLSRGRDDIKAVIFGHTHGRVLDPLDLDEQAGPFSYTKVYANCGTWSAGQAPSYVEIEPEGRDRFLNHVRIMEWKDGAPNKMDTMFFKT